MLDRHGGEWLQLPKAEVVLAVSLVLYGSGFFLSLYTTKLVRFNQFMPSLEVVGPGDGHSMVPSATPYW
jgi:hypothetical protein